LREINCGEAREEEIHHTADDKARRGKAEAPIVVEGARKAASDARSWSLDPLKKE